MNSGSDILDDSILVEKCLKGDKIAFQMLMSHHRRLMETAAFRIVKNSEAVQEVVQETMIRIFKGLHTFGNKCKLSTWIYRITLNESCRFLQKEHGRNSVPIDLFPEIPTEGSCSLQHLLEKEQRKLLKEQLNKLPEDFQETIRLHYFEDMKLEEIALKLNIPQGTVHSRIGRAREMLKERIKSLI